MERPLFRQGFAWNDRGLITPLRILAIVLSLGFAGTAHAQAPLIAGIDHIPIVVANLEQAEGDYRRMGFAIKPGRFHADGIRNAHVKFADGTELELITAPRAVDALTSEYRAKLQTGEGPVYFGLYAPDHPALRAKLAAAGAPVQFAAGALTFPGRDALHPLFFGSREKAPNDRPEYFAHPNTAFRLSGLWVRDRSEYASLLKKLGIALRETAACGPMGGHVRSAEFAEGSLFLVSGDRARGDVIGARVEVRNVAAVRGVLRKNGLSARAEPACDRPSVWLPPERVHGIWLQFVQAPPR